MLQIIVQVAIKAARPTMDASTPEPLKRLIAKCWAQVPDLLLLSQHIHCILHVSNQLPVPALTAWQHDPLLPVCAAT